MSALIFLFLAACSVDDQPEITDSSRVDKVIKLYDFANDPDGQFVSQFKTLSLEEVGAWVEGVHQADLAAYEELLKDPYVEKAVLNVSGLPADDPSLGDTPDEVSARIDAEGGTHYAEVRLSEIELSVVRAEIDEAHALRQSYHQNAVETFGKSFNNLSEAQWEQVDRLHKLSSQDLETLQSCDFAEPFSQGNAPFVGRERLARSVTFLGTVEDGNECDYLLRVSGTGLYDEVAQNPNSDFTCVTRLANLPVRPVTAYRRLTYGGSVWYILGARTRTILACGIRNQGTNFALSSLAE